MMVNDADSDPTNEIQTLTQSGSNLMLSNGGGSVTIPVYSSGAGININGSNIISNTGDTDDSDDITNTTNAAGDLGGTYPNPTVTAIRGNTVSNNNPNNNQVLKWNGSVWLPSADAVNDGDSNPSNELQTISQSGSNLTLSDGGGSVTIPVYSAGSGISINGSNAISNTGDTNAGDDITTSTSANGDLGGTYPNPTVNAIRGNAVSATNPSNNQVLKWNGSQWAPANDNAGSSVWQLSSSDAYYNGGDVGIGTSSPTASMEISANSSLSDPQLFLHENGNDYARIKFDNNNGSNYWTIASYIASNNRNDRLNFWNGTSGDLLSLTGDGRLGLNVGISPKTTFHIGNGHRVLFGIDTLGNGDKLMFLPDLHAFRVGTVATGAASTYWNRDSIGLYSFASGYNTRAQGYGATAMGRDTEATNSYAHATGYFTNADGLYSTAMGFNTDAMAIGTTSIGYTSDAFGNYSTAIGLNTLANSYACVAVGRYNVGYGSGTSWNLTDPIFEVGIGTSSGSRANAMTIRKNGSVGINTAFPTAELQVNGQIKFQTVEYFEDGGTNQIATRGSIRPTADNTYDLGASNFRWDDVFATNGTIQTSDRRSKSSIKELSYGLEQIMDLKPVKFKWKDSPENNYKLGFIAQDLLTVLPEVVKTHNWEATEEDESIKNKVELERLGVYYSDIIPVLVKGMQEQQEKIAELEKKIEQLQK